MHASSPSFPSGHSLLSAVVYLTLGSLLACFLVQRKLKVYVFSLALVVVFLVRASRKDILRLLVGAATGTRPKRVTYHALSGPDRQHFIPVATRRFIADAHTLGCPVHIWTVDDSAEAAELRARGANGILTNDPARLAAFGTRG